MRCLADRAVALRRLHRHQPDEALVSIDVNSGGRPRASHRGYRTQDQPEASEEVARQAAARDLAGLIVIDFIDMDEKRNKTARSSAKLSDCLRQDARGSRSGGSRIRPAGNVSRQRIRASVLESRPSPARNAAAPVSALGLVGRAAIACAASRKS